MLKLNFPLKGKHTKIIIVVMLVCAVIALYYTSSGEPQSQQVSTVESVDMEEKLGQILSAVAGAGRVEVVINYASSAEKVPAMQVQEQEDTTESSSNKSSVSDVAIAGQDPIIIREDSPQIEGVIVVAQGAGDIGVKFALLSGVTTVLGIDESKVEILKMSGD